MIPLFDIEHLIEKVISKLDVKEIAADVMSKMKIEKLDMYFVISSLHDSDQYELIGMTYNKEAAQELRKDNLWQDPRVIKLNMGKLLKLLEEMNAVEEVEEE